MSTKADERTRPMKRTIKSMHKHYMDTHPSIGVTAYFPSQYPLYTFNTAMLVRTRVHARACACFILSSLHARATCIQSAPAITHTNHNARDANVPTARAHHQNTSHHAKTCAPYRHPNKKRALTVCTPQYQSTQHMSIHHPSSTVKDACERAKCICASL